MVHALEFYCQFQFITLRHFSPKVRIKIGVNIFIKFYANSHCKSMLRCQCDILAANNKVKPKISFYSCSCKARDVLLEMEIKIIN